MTLLAPRYLQMVMENDIEYQQAKKLLWLDWDEEPNQLYQNPVTTSVVQMARALQQSDLIQGRIKLDNYQAVSQLVGMHDRWFAAAAKRELLRPFEG
ncbi:hypothetical protein HMPREF0501_01476 [Limosilactobacillus coleohominis 101-4-CHN]|uniref:Uncharacterized protein n=1 Tax=Limosilactobacillus coleohominis 101-4-CHN TaxID=575594 RepID=C7XXR2_9LACO|nr:hypothetical protein [Limosilactobacillus coleohominis]EEU29682.1 hypothetical protein HMPREF0501_01476 [Limosilactobacillus coleohominis 101-4-CHN]